MPHRASRSGSTSFPASASGYRVVCVDEDTTLWPACDLGNKMARLPKRWIVERTFAWISRNRRLARDFERYATTVVAFIRLAMNDDAQQEAQRVDQDVPLATLDFLARVVARRIERSPPFWAPFAV